MRVMIVGQKWLGAEVLRMCLERGELVSVRQELLERGEQRAHSALQVCVPLVDTDGRILALLAALARRCRAGDHVVFMSNGGFDGAPRRFLAQLGG